MFIISTGRGEVSTLINCQKIVSVNLSRNPCFCLRGLFEKRVNKFYNKCMCDIYTILINNYLFILHNLNFLYICNIYFVNYVM